MLQQEARHLAGANDADAHAIKAVLGQLQLRKLCCCRADRHCTRGDGGFCTHALAPRDSLFEEAVEMPAKAWAILAHFVHLLDLCQDLALPHDE